MHVRSTREGMRRIPDRARGWRRASALAGLVLLFAPMVAAAQERPYGWGWGMHPMWGVWGVRGIGMMLMMLAFWGVIIVGIVLAIRWLGRQSKDTRAADTALDILRERGQL